MVYDFDFTQAILTTANALPAALLLKNGHFSAHTLTYPS